MSHNNALSYSMFSFAILAILFLFVSAAFAAIPNLLNIQGKLTDINDEPKTGEFTFIFGIYNISTGGTPLWSETKKLNITNAGYFSTLLGSTTTLNLTFDQQYYLEINADGQTLLPRYTIGSTAYAFSSNNTQFLSPNATALQNFYVSQRAAINTTIIQHALNVVGSANITGTLYAGSISGTISVQAANITSGTLSGNFTISDSLDIAKYLNVSGGDFYVNDATGRIGINTTSPMTNLDVRGNINASGFVNATILQSVGNAYLALSTGSVGIGTASPIAKLDVQGNVNVSGFVNVTNLYLPSLSSCILLTDAAGKVNCNSTNSLGPGNGSTFESIASGTAAWSLPTRAQYEDASLATSTMNGFESSYLLRATNFSFSIPAGAAINGIMVEIKKKSSATDTITDSNASLVLSGTNRGSNYAGSYWPTTLTYTSYGSSTDLWGTTWTPAQINNATFGAEISAYNNDELTARTASVDHIRITVYYTLPPVTYVNNVTGLVLLRGTSMINITNSSSDIVFSFNNASLANLDARQKADNASVARTNAENTFTGNQIITGNLNVTSFINATQLWASRTDVTLNLSRLNVSATLLEARQSADNTSVARTNAGNFFTGNQNITGWMNSTSTFTKNATIYNDKNANASSIYIYDSAGVCKVRQFWNGTHFIITTC